MKKKLWAVLAVGVMMFGMAGVASATIVENVSLEFASGAVWNGSITFNDGYEGMIATDGYLNGGSNNHLNEHFTWTHFGYYGPNPSDGNSDGLYEDWLKSDSSSTEIGLSWDAAISVANNAITFSFLTNPYISGINPNDLLVSCNSNSNPVPEPATLLLMGSGIAGLIAARRKKKA